jgi:hypothetical protein
MRENDVFQTLLLYGVHNTCLPLYTIYRHERAADTNLRRRRQDRRQPLHLIPSRQRVFFMKGINFEKHDF